MYSKVKYVSGDATNPVGDGHKIICHVVNDMGKWGKGFVLALSNKWPIVKSDYKKWHEGQMDGKGLPFWPGTVMMSHAEGDSNQSIYVAHMLAQSGIRMFDTDKTVLQYDQLANCLGIVGEYALALEASVHMPMIGAGLAGGDWETIEKIIHQELVDGFGMSPTVYVLNDSNWSKINES